MPGPFLERMSSNRCQVRGEIGWLNRFDVGIGFGLNDRFGLNNPARFSGLANGFNRRWFGKIHVA